MPARDWKPRRTMAEETKAALLGKDVRPSERQVGFPPRTVERPSGTPTGQASQLRCYSCGRFGHRQRDCQYADRDGVAADLRSPVRRAPVARDGPTSPYVHATRPATGARPARQALNDRGGRRTAVAG